MPETKFDPTMVSVIESVPATALSGVNPLIVGFPFRTLTVKGW